MASHAHAQVNKQTMLAVLALALAAAGTPSAVHYASPDAGPSALCDCVKLLKVPGDECRLRARPTWPDCLPQLQVARHY